MALFNARWSSMAPMEIRTPGWLKPVWTGLFVETYRIRSRLALRREFVWSLVLRLISVFAVVVVPFFFFCLRRNGRRGMNDEMPFQSISHDVSLSLLELSHLAILITSN